MWQDRAACRDTDAVLFDLPPVVDNRWAELKHWRRETRPLLERICAGCPVQIECLDDAIEQGDQGVYRAGHELPGYTTSELHNCERCGRVFPRPRTDIYSGRRNAPRRFCQRGPDICKPAQVCEPVAAGITIAVPYAD